MSYLIGKAKLLTDFYLQSKCFIPFWIELMWNGLCPSL